MEVLASGLTKPWSVNFLSAEQIVLTERPGRIRIIDAGGVSAPLDGLPSTAGLLDVVDVSPVSGDTTLAISYLERDAQRQIGIAVGTGTLGVDRINDFKVVFRASPKMSTPVYSGGRMLVLPDQSMLVSVGHVMDRTYHDPNSEGHLGSIVQLVRDPSSPNRYRASVFATGIRNSQGLARDPKSDRLFFVDHGPQGGDELNLLIAGADYGWPDISAGKNYDGSDINVSKHRNPVDYIGPIRTWTPAIAPSGLAIYPSTDETDWNGSMFLGSLANNEIVRLYIDPRNPNGYFEERMPCTLGQRARDVKVGLDGLLYAITDDVNGFLLRISQ